MACCRRICVATLTLIDLDQKLGHLKGISMDQANHTRRFQPSTLRKDKWTLVLNFLMSLTCLAGCSQEVAEFDYDSGKSGGCDDGGMHLSTDTDWYRVDLGVVRPDEQIRHTFDVSNNSNQSWEVGAITKSCSCMHLDHDWNLIEPGESKRTSIVTNTDVKPSNIVRRAILHPKDPLQRAIALEISAIVRPPLHVSTTAIKAHVIRGNGSNAQAHTHWFIVQNYDKADWGGIEVTCNEPWIDIETVTLATHGPSRDCREAWRVNVDTSSAPLDSGMHSAVVNVRPLSPSEDCAPSASVPVLLNVVEAVSVAPSSLCLLQRASSRERTAELKIWRNDSLPLPKETVHVEINGPLSDIVKWELRQHDEGSVYLLLSQRSRSGEIGLLERTHLNTTLVLSVGGDVSSELQVPLSAEVY